MTQEDKELLLKDLCARLPYRVVCKCYHTEFNEWDGKPFVAEYDDILENIDAIGNCLVGGFSYDIEEFKPYLRSMSSMTEEEEKELSERYVWKINGSWIEIKYHSDGYWDNDIYCPTKEYLWLFNWLNKHHFDYRGLIEKSLTIAVTEENNPYKE